jgi:hypothetical protein
MTQMPRRRTGPNRLAWLLATKAAIALALAFPTIFHRKAAEYRALVPLPGLRPGTPVTLAGQRIGTVVAANRRGDTTALRVRFVRGAERLPGSRAVRLRRLGFAGTLVLEIRIANVPTSPRHARSFALGGWLHVLPSDSEEDAFVDPRDSPLPTLPPSPFGMPVFPPTRPAPTAGPIART